jgi:hypothetical protein
MNNRIDPVDPAGLYKPLSDTELRAVRPLSGAIDLLFIAGFGLFKRVAALSSALRTSLTARGYR